MLFLCSDITIQEDAVEWAMAINKCIGCQFPGAGNANGFRKLRKISLSQRFVTHIHIRARNAKLPLFVYDHILTRRYALCIPTFLLILGMTRIWSPITLSQNKTITRLLLWRPRNSVEVTVKENGYSYSYDNSLLAKIGYIRRQFPR